jgi:hypothetical protein
MTEEQGQPADVWLAHVRVLAQDIGPRGSTTEGERRGSEYCREVLDRLGLAPQVEPFTSARSIYHPLLLAAIGLLAAFVIYPLAGRLSAGIAAAVSLAMLVFDLMELGFRDNLLRRLVPKGASQNVVAVAPPRAEHLQDLVLIGHVDSHRSPIFFSSTRWLAAYTLFLKVGFAAFSAQIILYALGTVAPHAWIWPATFVSAACAAAMAMMCIHADRTPFSPGANDNATGAGLVLALAGQLRHAPFEHTRVWLVCTGCEEVQHYGAIDFFRRHRGDLVDALAVVFESMGCDGPAWLTREGIIVPFHADPGLAALAERLAAEHPEWGAYPTWITGGNTEMADALRAGLPAITLCGITRKGLLPYWHQPGDTLDKIDPAVLARSYAFTRAYLEAIDLSGRRP